MTGKWSRLILQMRRQDMWWTLPCTWYRGWGWKSWPRGSRRRSSSGWWRISGSTTYRASIFPSRCRSRNFTGLLNGRISGKVPRDIAARRNASSREGNGRKRPDAAGGGKGGAAEVLQDMETRLQGEDFKESEKGCSERSRCRRRKRRYRESRMS